LLLSAPASTQARTGCAIGRHDVAPCADETPDRLKSRVEPPKESASFVAWIAEKTGWTVREVPPIRFVPYAQLVKMFRGGRAPDYHVESLYSEIDHTIYLPDSWRPENLRDRSVLLHELVHHLQYRNNIKATCPGDHEYEAIELQITWLREQDVDDPLNLLGINPLFIFMLRRCGE
jgi:hypothetical protein